MVSVSSRSAQSAQRVPGQPRLHGQLASHKQNKNHKDWGGRGIVHGEHLPNMHNVLGLTPSQRGKEKDCEIGRSHRLGCGASGAKYQLKDQLDLARKGLEYQAKTSRSGSVGHRGLAFTQPAIFQIAVFMSPSLSRPGAPGSGKARYGFVLFLSVPTDR